MDERQDRDYIAFDGMQCIAAGGLAQVALEAKRVLDRDLRARVLLFDAQSSEGVEVDFRGSEDEVVQRIAASGAPEARVAKAPGGPGRPKLGVVAREVTLLPRHWEWLNGQPGGASVALRKLVEAARRANDALDRRRLARDSAYRFMTVLAGDLPGYEEAVRALFAGDRARFDALTAPWPADVRDHARRLAAPAWLAADEAGA